MPTPIPHDWFRPKLAALVAEAASAGIARDVSVAVITDLINGPLFSAGEVETNEGWNQDIGEPTELVNPNNPASAEPNAADAIPDTMPYIGRNNAGWV
jgi:hypothetical protein